MHRPSRLRSALWLCLLGALIGMETGAMESRWIAYQAFHPWQAFGEEALLICFHYATLFGGLGLLLGLLRPWRHPERLLCVLAFAAAVWLLPYQATSLPWALVGIAFVAACCWLYLVSSKKLRAIYLLGDGVCTVLLLAGYPRLAPSPPTTVNPSLPNIVLVVLDTLRADHLSCYGHNAVGQPTSPQIDALAATGTLFEHAYAQAPWTRPSVATIFTGLYPASHGIVTPYDQLPNNLPTLATVLRQQGYQTIGFSANPQISAGFGFAQGFQRFWSSTTHLTEASAGVHLGNKLKRALGLPSTIRPLERGVAGSTADDVNHAVRMWLQSANKKQPTFLYLHYLDPHDPYSAPEDLFGQVGMGRVDEKPLYASQELPPFPLPGSQLPSLSDDAMQALQYQYDAEIRYVDDRLGKILQDLRQAGLWTEQDYLVLCYDHGEEFHEHQQWQHGRSLFEEMIHVPLIVVGPNIPEKREQSLVELADVLPTIAQWSGATLDFPHHGESLLQPRQKNRVFSHRPREKYPIWALRTQSKKLIWIFHQQKLIELAYNLNDDPKESNALLEDASIDPLRKQLNQLMRTSAAFAPAKTQSKPLSDSMQQALEQLGYVDGQD